MEGVGNREIEGIIFSLPWMDSAVLYPKEAIARLFENRDQALEFFDCLVDFLNDIDFREDSLEPDYKKFKHVPVLKILKLLPRTNYKECRLSSCMALAAAPENGESFPGDCPEYKTSGTKNEQLLKKQ